MPEWMEHDLSDEDLEDNRQHVDNVGQHFDDKTHSNHLNNNQGMLQNNIPEVVMNSDEDLRLGSAFTLIIVVLPDGEKIIINGNITQMRDLNRVGDFD